ncbi:hypothetical protein QBC46DRAFT_275147 [Diplogelasinospora grovesii]|uniref:Uncharacterized protein n=1 Tax=Diplogelasinospora grovesii TaxID=303347 RepID=A0AAN6MVF5_9PEZI|nr:hypothetical protein QBC46DRAFT_275147 [Diplogelasinospora grovesii]
MKEDIDNDVAKDDDLLRKKISELFGDKATLGEETVGSGGYDFAPLNICGVLVCIKSDHGAVRVLGGKDAENVETHPEQREQYCIVHVNKNQSCAILGGSKYRCIYS